MKILLVLLAVAVIAGGIYVFAQNTAPVLEQTESTQGMTQAPTEDNAMVVGEGQEPQEATSTTYVPYSQTAYDAASDKKRVLFFHASWCPTCKVANEDFEQNTTQIPSDVVVFKTDYDTEKALKEKYEITYQHTFVQVDGQGNQVTKWNGGGVDEVITRTK